MIQTVKTEILSADGIHTLRGIVLLPEQPRGILQIAHGMTEHIGRYVDFMTYLAENGFIVCGHDHLGHGKTAAGKEEFGYFAKKDGARTVCEDVWAFGKAIREDYPGLPFFLLGHSMGSFIVRCAVSEHPDACDALIVMGTGGKNPLSAIGLLAARLIRAICGEKHVSRFISHVAFSSYNKRTGSDHPFAWISRDPEVLAKRDADPFCTFPFTVCAMYDLIRLQSLCNRRSWYERVRTDLPILLVSGAEDPVGNYGKGVEEVYEKLIAQGVTDVSRKLYPGMRHEILNEIGREEAYADILNFLISQISEENF